MIKVFFLLQKFIKIHDKHVWALKLLFVHKTELFHKLFVT